MFIVRNVFNTSVTRAVSECCYVLEMEGNHLLDVILNKYYKYSTEQKCSHKGKMSMSEQFSI